MGTVSIVEDIKPYSAKDLAKIYGVCDKTFKRWAKPFVAQIGEKNGRYYTVAQVKVIFEKIGVPSKIKD